MDSSRDFNAMVEDAKTPYISKEEASFKAMVEDARMPYVNKEEARENIKAMKDIGFNDPYSVIGQSKSGQIPYVVKDDFHEFEDEEWIVISKRTDLPHASVPYFMTSSGKTRRPTNRAYESNMTMKEIEQQMKWLEEESLHGCELFSDSYRFYPWS